MLLFFFTTRAACAAPADLPSVPPRQVPALPLPEGGRQIAVKTADELASAVSSARDDDVILLTDGTYRVANVLKLDRVKNVTIRGASKDPSLVILRGHGFEVVNSRDDILRIARCENIVIAYLTFADCHAYGLKVEAEHSPKDIHVYHCHFLNIGTRGLKGSTAQKTIAAGGSVRYCHFENNKVPPSHWQFGGNYISAIDMMSLEDWTFSDNTFVNIKGHSGGGRAAIFVWVVVGRMDNWFVDPPTGDLRLAGLASDAIDQGITLRDVVDDIDANRRDSHPDIGAHELSR